MLECFRGDNYNMINDRYYCLCFVVSILPISVPERKTYIANCQCYFDVNVILFYLYFNTMCPCPIHDIWHVVNVFRTVETYSSIKLINSDEGGVPCTWGLGKEESTSILDISLPCFHRY